MPAVITIGEILADLVPESKFYILMPGGAVSNVAVNLARLKVKTGIISKIGDDFLGKFLLNFLIKNNVDVYCVTKIKKYKTGLVFVFLDKKGERDFSFYGNPSADQFLNVKDIKEEYIKGCELLHFGSISMIGYKSRAATLKAIKIAKKYGKKISYDPNVRINLAENGIKKFRENIKMYFKYADIIKISDFEFEFQIALMNRKLDPEIHTLFLLPNEKYTYLNSSIVRELARYGKDVSEFVPAIVSERIKLKF